MELTTRQKSAIEHKGKNLQLIACAGSGKTEVVARRVVHLLTLDKGALKPENIVAFTFTEKAAAELKERIVTRTKEALGPTVHGLADMFVGTIHAFALDLVRSECPEYLKHDVLNEVQQELFINRYCQKSGLTASTDLDSQPLKRYRDTKNYLTALATLREANTIEEKLIDCSVAQGLEKYESLLMEKVHFDYSSLLKVACDVLCDESTQQRLAERIRYVIVDEYQDVNPVQEKIVHLLAQLGARVCVVGDDDQTIYQWRGSDVDNIQKFSQRYNSVDRIDLEDNFRSSVGIVETAKQFIEKNQVRLNKEMKSACVQDYEDNDIIALSFDSPEEEARHVAATVKALHGIAFLEEGINRGLSWSDMAVLFRSVRKNAAFVAAAFDAENIPYIVTGMNNLFERVEAQAARSIFYFMGDYKDTTAQHVRRAWTEADLGLDSKHLAVAIKGIINAKRSLGDSPKPEYYIQRVFINFLQEAGVREEQIPDGRAQTVMHNLGKFSEIISDFETIHFHSDSKRKYADFASFLAYRAESTYPEGWQDGQYVHPDAVKIMTVHQAKGMQWPVVFIPALLRNRFPAAKRGGRNQWHLIPPEAVKNQERFDGTLEDERRLFYVAMTRSQKFLHLTWAPIPRAGNRYRCRSEFWDNILESKYVKRQRAPDYATRARLPAEPKLSIENVTFSFSNIKYFFQCPYHFKLRVLYGFNMPIHIALGYGKSLHDALAEIHGRAVQGEVIPEAEVPRLVKTHLHVPYAHDKLREALRKSAGKVLRKYLHDNASEFDNIEFSEKFIEINLSKGVRVTGRIDLVRRIDTGETTIVDLKTSDQAQAEEVTEAQLHTYALGYQELTGRSADYVATYILDKGKRVPRAVDAEFIAEVEDKVGEAAATVSSGQFLPKPSQSKCAKCDFLGMCSAGQKTIKFDDHR